MAQKGGAEDEAGSTAKDDFFDDFQAEEASTTTATSADAEAVPVATSASVSEEAQAASSPVEEEPTATASSSQVEEKQTAASTEVPVAAPAATDTSTGVSEEVLARWHADIDVIFDSIRLMLSNRLAEADQKLEEASRNVESREIDFAAGDHDLRGCFAFVNALMSLLNGLASLENNQLDMVLTRVWAADELLAMDGDWAGKTVLRGLCIFVAGLVEVMQGAVTRGVWHVLRSWLFLRYLESDGLNFKGHERDCVRSTSLLALGVFNLLTSMLPPTAMKTATWITGFKGGRDTAMEQLRTCWQEGGIQAPFAGLVLIGFAVDVSSFLGEFRSERERRYQEARKILDWASEKYPDSFFFDGLEANYLSVTRDLDAALAKLEHVAAVVKDMPALAFIVHIRTATFLTSKFEWLKAAEAYRAAAAVHAGVKRRAFCPVLLLNAHLCYLAGGEAEKALEALEQCRTYRHEKKKWSNVDGLALKQAELAHKQMERASSAGDENDAEENADSEPATDAAETLPWRPRLVLYQKICILYRAVTFMPPEQVDVFVSMVRDEMKECSDDADNLCIGHWILAEAMRQSESWDEALQVAADGLALAPRLSAAGAKTGALQFMRLICAYAHHAQGRPGAAREALGKLDSNGSDHFYAKQVEFKATHLRQLVGAKFQDSYTELTIPARSSSRLVIEVPEGTESGAVEWDWVLTAYTVSFVATYFAAGEDEGRELKRVEQHQADAGPQVGCLDVAGPGRLELVFDNAFSLLRGKTVQCRVQPSSLVVTRQN